MGKIHIPVGTSNFAEIRKEHYYFIDKSGLIEELLKTDGTKVTLITRPRRFGKTLAMSMLAEFFDIQKDSSELFQGLSIANHGQLCKSWMNQYPTLFLTFKDVGGNTFDSAYEMLRDVLAKACNAHYYLKDSDLVNENDKKVFLHLADIVDGKPTGGQVKTGIALLLRMLHAHYKKPAILLLDEYDVPIAKAKEDSVNSTDYYRSMMEVISSMISSAIKDNDHLKFAVITGCLKITKESIFTGTNNFVSDTISDTRLNEYFGFTQEEVDRLLTDTGLAGHGAEIKEWYDGYHFGAFDIYCPWDVMNHVKNLLLNPAIKPVGYWKNSSSNSVIRSFINHIGDGITQKLEMLLAGNYIIEKIETDLTYRELYTSEGNFWSVLYLTGYLTQIRGQDLGKNLQKDYMALVIPNQEIKELFESTIKIWFEENTLKWDRTSLFTAIWERQPEIVTLEMTKLLRKTISYYDYREDFYHAFFAGIFAGAGYAVESNREHGEGRSDIVVKDYGGDRLAVFEIKYSKSQKELEKDCEQALIQMNDRMYAKEFEEDYADILCYGISFFKKRCLVKLKEAGEESEGEASEKALPI